MKGIHTDTERIKKQQQHNRIEWGNILNGVKCVQRGRLAIILYILYAAWSVALYIYKIVHITIVYRDLKFAME